ncbi:hypothetical protein HID58_090079 [Brassica napus]|uniref:Ovate family protein n=2 Tax=Brassica napus TaxID=3708 RepID=A0ABQ7XE92_BRANA|nr:hypothetical protein HID58_090079 [Brassica napus]
MEDSSTRSQKKRRSFKETTKKHLSKEQEKELPNCLVSLKKSLHCKSELSDVHDLKSTKHLTTISTKRNLPRHLRRRMWGRLSGCSRSIANLKDVIHGSKRHFEKPPISGSPRSIGSNEFLNPMTHEVILSSSTCEIKITGVGDMASPAEQRNPAEEEINGPRLLLGC